MQIPTEEIRNGLHNGKTVWICHYSQPDLNKKPLRNQPPAQCIIISNDELPADKNVYYSASHFRSFKKDMTPSSKIISPVDNTGFRSRPGNELFVFDNEIECNESWNSQINDIADKLEVLINTSVVSLKERQRRILDMKR